jgi:magnesium transporter
MIANYFEINDALQLTPVTTEAAVLACQHKRARIWIDLMDFQQAELEGWLDKLNITDLPRQLCLEARDRSGIYPLKDALFLVMPVLVGPADRQDTDYVAFLCMEHLLLTPYQKDISSEKHLASIKHSEAWLSAPSIAGLVSAIMIDVTPTCLHHTSDLCSEILSLEQRMDREPENVSAEEILELRSELVIIGALASDQLPVIRALIKTDKTFFQLKDTREYMRCALVNAQAASASLNWLDKRINALRAGFEMHAQDQTNRRLNMLTILSAIFNPATLLAGIWGMNYVNMPELQYPLGYPIAIGIMVLIGVMMFLIFRRGGWFD